MVKKAWDNFDKGVNPSSCMKEAQEVLPSAEWILGISVNFSEEVKTVNSDTYLVCILSLNYTDKNMVDAAILWSTKRNNTVNNTDS